jgi:hypothetical protein
MPDRNDKLVRIHNDTLSRLELYRTHYRDTPNDLINHALDKLFKLEPRRDGHGRFVKDTTEELIINRGESL